MPEAPDFGQAETGGGTYFTRPPFDVQSMRRAHYLKSCRMLSELELAIESD